jgi:hypothetical protein
MKTILMSKCSCGQNKVSYVGLWPDLNLALFNCVSCNTSRTVKFIKGLL